MEQALQNQLNHQRERERKREVAEVYVVRSIQGTCHSTQSVARGAATLTNQQNVDPCKSPESLRGAVLLQISQLFKSNAHLPTTVRHSRWAGWLPWKGTDQACAPLRPSVRVL